MTISRFTFGSVLVAGLVLAGAAANAQTGEVVWYGYSGKHVAATVKAFNVKYPNVEVKTITAEGGELIARLQAEKERPQADICFCSGDHYFNYPFLWQPRRSRHHDAFPEWGVLKNGNDILAYGYTISIQVFIINTNVMPFDKAPKSWGDLLKPEYKGKFMVGNPSLTSAGYYSFFQVLQTYGWDAMENYVENAVFSPSVNAVPVSVARGEMAMGLSEETKSWAQAEQGFPVKVYYPTEGIIPTMSGIGVVKNPPHPENAVLLADFILSEEGQNINVATRNRRVPRIGANVPKGLVPFSELKFNEKANEAEANTMHTEWVKKFDEIFSRKSK